jgi:hypothetical protein
MAEIEKREPGAQATIPYPLPARRRRMLTAADDRMSGQARAAHEKGRHVPAFPFAVPYFAGVSAGFSPAAGAAGVAGAAGAEGTDASGLAGAAGTEPAPGTEAAPGTDEPAGAGAAPGTCGTERSAGKLCITPESTAGLLLPLWLT